MSQSLIYVTAPGAEVAKAIGRALVEARLAAGANVLPGVTSFYWWEGELREGAEAVVIVKTRDELVAATIEAVRARHPYDCPCVVVLPITAGNPAYLDWIGEETREA